MDYTRIYVDRIRRKTNDCFYPNKCKMKSNNFIQHVSVVDWTFHHFILSLVFLIFDLMDLCYSMWTCAPRWNICPHGNVHKENICLRRTMMLMEEKPDFIWFIRFMELYWHKSKLWNKFCSMFCGKMQHRQSWYTANMLSKLAECVFKLFRRRSETNSTSALTERISG